jgi:hypothetical protein
MCPLLLEAAVDVDAAKGESWRSVSPHVGVGEGTVGIFSCRVQQLM